MRGQDDRDEGLFSYVRLEARIPLDHPLRAIRALADEALSPEQSLRRALFRDGPAFDPAEDAAADDAAAGIFSVRSERRLI